MKTANIGDTYLFTIPEDPDDEFGFIRSKQYEDMQKLGANSMEIKFIENIDGFENWLSYEIRLVKSDGSYVRDWEYMIEDPIEEDKEEFNDVWVEEDSDTSFLNYLMKYEQYITKQ